MTTKNLMMTAQAAGGAFDPETSITWASLLYVEDSVTTKPSDATSNRYWSDAMGAASNNYFDASSNSARWPEYDASNTTMNGQPALIFSDIEGYGVTGSLGSAVPPPWSVVVIAVATENGFLAVTGAGGEDVEWHASGLAIRNPTYRNSGVVAPDYTNAHLYVWVCDGASSKVSIDGAAPTTITSGSPGTNNATTFRPAGLYGWPNKPVSLAGLYDGDITADAAWPALKTWVTDHYGITIA